MTSSTLNQPLLVLTNVPEAALGASLARQLVEQGLAACVQLAPALTSIYRWQGQVEQAQEIPLMIKTTQARYLEVEQAICAVHPYEVPEIVAVPLVAGLPAYLQWLDEQTRPPLRT